MAAGQGGFRTNITSQVCGLAPSTVSRSGEWWGTPSVRRRSGRVTRSPVSTPSARGSGSWESGLRYLSSSSSSLSPHLPQCSASCDSGSQSRSVSCEWLAGGLAPDTECSAQESRPAATIQCFGPPCRQDWGPEPSIVVSPSRDGREVDPCQDTSKFCGLVLRGTMCRAEGLREQCCRTCTLG